MVRDWSFKIPSEEGFAMLERGDDTGIRNLDVLSCKDTDTDRTEADSLVLLHPSPLLDPLTVSPNELDA